MVPIHTNVSEVGPAVPSQRHRGNIRRILSSARNRQGTRKHSDSGVAVMTINDIKNQPRPLPAPSLSPALGWDLGGPAPSHHQDAEAGSSRRQHRPVHRVYDFTLYGLTAVIFSQLFFPGSDPVAAMLATFATFGVAFVSVPSAACSSGRLATGSAGAGS